MSHSPSTQPAHMNMETDENLVEFWLRKDPVRWVAGALAGILAGLVALAFSGALSASIGLEFLFPVKLIGTIIHGPYATEFQASTGMVITGFVLFEVVTAFLGAVFAHFTFSNSMGPLLAMGVVWGIFSWIFIWNLFAQSFRPIRAANISSAMTLPVCIAMGLTLASVAFFDGMLRGSKR